MIFSLICFGLVVFLKFYLELILDFNLVENTYFSSINISIFHI